MVTFPLGLCKDAGMEKLELDFNSRLHNAKRRVREFNN
jgi:hypothetical protein